MAGSKKSIFRKRLTKMQDAAADAMQDYTPGFQHIQDGIYEARITAEIRESSNGNLMIAQTYTIVGGEYEGQKVWSNLMLEKIDDETGERIPNYNGIVFSRRWLESMGIEYPEDDLGQLEEIIEQINDCAPACKIKVRTTKSKLTEDEFQNVNIMEMLDWGEEEGEEESEEEGEEEEEQTDDDDEEEEESEEEEEESEEESEEEGEFSSEDVLAFCASQGIETVDDEMELDDIIAEVLTYQFKENEITEEEKEMLLALGLPEEQIVPAKPKRQKPTPPKPKPTAPKAKTTKGKTTAKTATSKKPTTAATKKKTTLPPKSKAPAKGKTTAGKGRARIGIRKK